MFKFLSTAHNHRSNHITSNRNVRRSHSGSFFKVTSRTEEDINQRPEILHEEDNTAPACLVHVASTVTLTEGSFEVDNDLLLTENQKERNRTYLAIKLNRLKDKQARFVSHKKLLTHWVAEELVPKGLEIALERTIVNHEQEFLDNWYSRQEQFSLSLLKGIVQFCEKTIKKSAQDIKKPRKFSKENCKPKPVTCHPNRNKRKWRFHEKSFTATKVQKI